MSGESFVRISRSLRTVRGLLIPWQFQLTLAKEESLGRAENPPSS